MRPDIAAVTEITGGHISGRWSSRNHARGSKRRHRREAEGIGAMALHGDPHANTLSGIGRNDRPRGLTIGGKD
jgi:hypothetical protein